MKPTQTVYSYYLPEVRPFVDRALVPYPHSMYTENIDPGLDDLHIPVLDLYEKRFSGDVANWASLPYRYWTNGSSEALFHLLAYHATHRAHRPLYQLEGEYQGYEAYADALGLTITTLPPDPAAIREAPRGVFIVSHPSAIDGNLLDPILYHAITDSHLVILDVAYMGTTIQPLRVDLANENIIALVASMSKPFGLYYYRCGLLWTRDEMSSLYGNRWFKNAASIKVAHEVLHGVDIDALKDTYREKQVEAVDRLWGDSGIAWPSDVWLLAHGYGAFGPQEFKRGNGYRYCLTPVIKQADDHTHYIGDPRSKLDQLRERVAEKKAAEGSGTR